MRQLDINPDNTSLWYLRKRPSKIFKSRKFQARSTIIIVKSLPFASKGEMYLWTIRCAANTAQLQPRVLYPFSVPSLHSLPMQNLSRAFGSLICQQLAPGGSRSREMRSLETERCVWHAAAAALRQVLPSSRLCPLAGPSLEPGLRSGFLRQAGAPDRLPASCSSPPNELHSRPARANPEISRQLGGPAPQQAWLRVHTCLPGPPPFLPATPGDYSPAAACVGPVPFSSRGGLRKGSNSTSSSSAACSHLSGSVSGGGSRGRRTRTAQGNLLRTNSAPALAAEAESFIIVRPTPPGDPPQGRARARLRRRRGWRQTT